MKHGKKYRESLKKYDPAKAYGISEACQLVKDLHYVKFDETVELSVSLKLEKTRLYVILLYSRISLLLKSAFLFSVKMTV